MYAVVALGLSLIFGIIRVINFAHGSILMLFMYLGFFLWKLFGVNPYLSILVVVPAAFGLGYFLQRFIIRRMFIREKAYVVEPLGVLMLMAGVDMVISNAALLGFGSLTKAIPHVGEGIHVGFLLLSLPRSILIPIAIALTFGIYWMLNHTELGNVIRSVGQDREAAATCGIDVHHIYALTFGIGCAVTALGGSCLLPFQPIQPYMGLGLAIKAFIIVVLGGLGSIRGSLVAGVIIGVIESMVGQVVSASIATVFSLVVFLVIIFLRPKGLMGRIEV